MKSSEEIKANDLVLVSGSQSRKRMAQVIDVVGEDAMIRTVGGIAIVDINRLKIAQFASLASERRTRRLLEGR